MFRKYPELPVSILDILPNPVLVKDENLRYVWVNAAFEDLFDVKRDTLIGELDVDVFPDRQVAQCNGGDLRVLGTGVIDEAYETVYKFKTEPRVTITRKSRLENDGHHFLVGIMHDVTDVTQTNEELEASKKLLEEQSVRLKEMAYTDPLTGVLNRRRLAELAPVVFGTHRDIGAALVCDLDHFKRINDAFGHDAGDAGLRHFVSIARSILREGDLIARVGGEEFALLLPGTNETESALIAERVRETLENSPLIYGGQRIPMTVSIGVAYAYGKKEFVLDDLLNLADKGLYLAKNDGRNCVVKAAA